MPDAADAAELSTFARNLRKLIDSEELSVNAWARKYQLTQTTINRIVSGSMDPTVGLVEKISSALSTHGPIHITAWQLLVDGFEPDLLPTVLDPNDRDLFENWKASLRLIRQKEDRRHGDRWVGPGPIPKRRFGDPQ